MKWLSRIEKIILFLFLFLIPTQLGKHFWPDWSKVSGIRVDYLSPTLYLTDLLAMGVIGLRIMEGKLKEKRINYGILLFLFLAAVNIILAASREVAIYKWLRIGEWIAMFWVIRKKKGRVEEILKYVLSFWFLIEGGLVLAQVMKGGSIEGWWWWLGERRFEYGSLGIAQMRILGQGLVRGYGTFSHPNSLAGFILVAMVLWMREKKKGMPLLWWWTGWWVGFGTILLSGSRTSWGLVLILLLSLLWAEKERIKLMVGGTVVALGFGALIFASFSVNYNSEMLIGGWDSQGVEKRLQLSLAAMEMIRSNPLFGVGAGNYLVRLPEVEMGQQFYWLQPVHNIWLLITSEIGVMGLMAVGFGMYYFIDKRKIENSMEWKLVGIIILVTGMVDHYWLTLPQNTWILALVLGLI